VKYRPYSFEKLKMKLCMAQDKKWKYGELVKYRPYRPYSVEKLKVKNEIMHDTGWKVKIW